MGNASSKNDSTLSTFSCSGHNQMMQFNQKWEFCDIHCNFYCIECVQKRRVNDPHTLSKGRFGHPWERWNGKPKSCDVCKCAWNPPTHGGDQWSGFTCLEHNFDVCFDCLIRENKPPHGVVPMQNHRQLFHSSKNPVNWVLFASTKEENDRRLQKRNGVAHGGPQQKPWNGYNTWCKVLSIHQGGPVIFQREIGSSSYYHCAQCCR